VLPELESSAHAMLHNRYTHILTPQRLSLPTDDEVVGHVVETVTKPLAHTLSPLALGSRSSSSRGRDLLTCSGANCARLILTFFSL
jgi:hypothetical protein